MKTLLLLFITISIQAPVTVVKNNGDQLGLSKVKIFQEDTNGSTTSINYSFRGEGRSVTFSEIKRISFKETIKKKKGVTTFRAILVRADNSKLEVEIDLVRLEGVGKSGKMESMSFSSIDKISF